MRFLIRFGHGANLGQNTFVIHALAKFAGHIVSRPEDILGWNLPVLARMTEGRVGPGLHNNLKMLLVEFLFELLVPFRVSIVVGQDVVVLTQGIDPARLIAAGKANKGPAFCDLVENGGVFSHADRVLAGEDQAELSQPDVLGLHAEIQVEHEGIGRNLFAFDMEVVFGKANAIVAVRIEILSLFGQIAQHALVQVCPPTSHTCLQLTLIANRGKIENTEFHKSSLL